MSQFSLKKFLLWLVSLMVSFQLVGCHPVDGRRTDRLITDRQAIDGAAAESPAHASFVSAEEFAQIIATERLRQSAPFVPLDQPAGSDEPVRQGTIVAGVVPHHLVAGALIIELLREIAAQAPEVIVLVGPNHHNQGSRVITGFSDWQTPLGPAKTERNVVRALLDTKKIYQDEAVLDQEHAVGNLIPLIKHCLPKAQVVPIILHHDVSLTEVDELLDVLKPLLVDKKAILLASVDFSHYLTREQAQKKDCFTLQVMKNFDYVTLFRLNNDYLDSPASLAMAFRLAEKKGSGDFRLLGNTNSGEIFQDNNMETTSYFTILFAEK